VTSNSNADPARRRVVRAGFNRRVYAVVRRVEPGFVTTYGDVATILGSPRVARHVGFALAALTDPDVPWHRVINAQGLISFRGDVGRSGEQRALLEAEGVEFDERERVDLKRFRWPYPDSSPPPEAD
jgi:methylated-DNA-protein-cysteine methyltransferase related protein